MGVGRASRTVFGIGAKDMSELMEKGKRAKRESKYVDFKQSFDPGSNGEWCELIKDIVAMANTGGGVILVGLDNGGKPTGENVQTVLELDQAEFADKIGKYTGSEPCEVDVQEGSKCGVQIAIIEVSGVEAPIVFQRPGTYQVASGKQKTAFSRGTVYFRHGAKSEPGTTADLRRVVEQRLDTIRKQWLDGVRKVVTSPRGSSIAILSGDVTESRSPSAAPIRLVKDSTAPEYRLIDQDTTYPYRQKELIEVVNERLPDGATVNSHDILCIRRSKGIDGDLRYCHQPKFGSPQYNDAFVAWIVDQHEANEGFFEQCRKRYYEETHSGEVQEQE